MSRPSSGAPEAPGCQTLPVIWAGLGTALSLLSGDVSGAIGHNALMFLLGLPLLALLWFFWLRGRVGGPPAPGWARSRTAVYTWLALTVVFTVVRNLPWAPFTVLAA